MNNNELVEWWLNLSDEMGGRSELDADNTVVAIREVLVSDELFDIGALEMVGRLRLAANYALSLLERELGESLADPLLLTIVKSQVVFAEQHAVVECFLNARLFAEAGPGEGCPHQWMSTIGALSAAALREEQRKNDNFEAEMEAALSTVADRAINATAEFGEE